jgi:hypothetical protein
MRCDHGLPQAEAAITGRHFGVRKDLETSCFQTADYVLQ